MRFLSLASMGTSSWLYPLASMTLGGSMRTVGFATGSTPPVSVLALPMRISIFLPPVRSGSSLIVPRAVSSVGTRMSSTILCILLSGLSDVAKKSLKEDTWWFTMLRSVK